MRLYIKLVLESIAMALQAISANKFRAFLSLLSVCIGVFSIIAVFAAIDSLENKLKKSVESLGDNVVFIQKWPWAFGGDYPWWKYLNRPHPNINDWEWISRNAEYSAAQTFMVESFESVNFNNISLNNIQITAITKGYDQVITINIEDGRFFALSELDGGIPLAVIGNDIAKYLFRDLSPVGKKIKVKNKQLTVIGVLKKEGDSILGGSSDQQILVPFKVASTIFNTRSDRLNPRIMVKAKEGVSLTLLKSELTKLMRSSRALKIRAEDNFALNETSILSKGFADFFRFISIVGAIIGGFSILVGGFGIANIMFVSVKERTKLIGIQKALGAKNHFILTQFLTEAVFLCLIGAMLALMLIFSITQINFIKEFGLVLSVKNILTGLSIATIIGVLAGISPALKASRLNPVDAIRSNG